MGAGAAWMTGDRIRTVWCMTSSPQLASRFAPTTSRGRVWRYAVATAVVVLGAGLHDSVANAEEPAPADTSHVPADIEVGEVDGVVVAVDAPPVPVTTVADVLVVEVGEPPVPPVTVADAVVVQVGLPPVPPVVVADAEQPQFGRAIPQDVVAESIPVQVDPVTVSDPVVVEVGQPPIPPFTVPDAGSSADVTPAPPAVPVVIADRLPATGAETSLVLSAIAACLMAFGSALTGAARRR